MAILADELGVEFSPLIGSFTIQSKTGSAVLQTKIHESLGWVQIAVCRASESTVVKNSILGSKYRFVRISANIAVEKPTAVMTHEVTSGGLTACDECTFAAPVFPPPVPTEPPVPAPPPPPPPPEWPVVTPQPEPWPDADGNTPPVKWPPNIPLEPPVDWTPEPVELAFRGKAQNSVYPGDTLVFNGFVDNLRPSRSYEFVIKAYQNDELLDIEETKVEITSPVAGGTVPLTFSFVVPEDTGAGKIRVTLTHQRLNSAMTEVTLDTVNVPLWTELVFSGVVTESGTPGQALVIEGEITNLGSGPYSFDVKYRQNGAFLVVGGVDKKETVNVTGVAGRATAFSIETVIPEASVGALDVVAIYTDNNLASKQAVIGTVQVTPVQQVSFAFNSRVGVQPGTSTFISGSITGLKDGQHELVVTFVQDGVKLPPSEGQAENILRVRGTEDRSVSIAQQVLVPATAAKGPISIFIEHTEDGYPFNTEVMTTTVYLDQVFNFVTPEPNTFSRGDVIPVVGNIENMDDSNTTVVVRFTQNGQPVKTTEGGDLSFTHTGTLDPATGRLSVDGTVTLPDNVVDGPITLTVTVTPIIKSATTVPVMDLVVLQEASPEPEGLTYNLTSDTDKGYPNLGLNVTGTVSGLTPNEEVRIAFKFYQNDEIRYTGEEESNPTWNTVLVTGQEGDTPVTALVELPSYDYDPEFGPYEVRAEIVGRPETQATAFMIDIYIPARAVFERAPGAFYVVGQELPAIGYVSDMQDASTTVYFGFEDRGEPVRDADGQIIEIAKEGTYDPETRQLHFDTTVVIPPEINDVDSDLVVRVINGAQQEFILDAFIFKVDKDPVFEFETPEGLVMATDGVPFVGIARNVTGSALRYRYVQDGQTILSSDGVPYSEVLRGQADLPAGTLTVNTTNYMPYADPGMITVMADTTTNHGRTFTNELFTFEFEGDRNAPVIGQLTLQPTATLAGEEMTLTGSITSLPRKANDYRFEFRQAGIVLESNALTLNLAGPENATVSEQLNVPANANNGRVNLWMIYTDNMGIVIEAIVAFTDVIPVSEANFTTTTGDDYEAGDTVNVTGTVTYLTAGSNQVSYEFRQNGTPILGANDLPVRYSYIYQGAADGLITVDQDLEIPDNAIPGDLEIVINFTQAGRAARSEVIDVINIVAAPVYTPVTTAEFSDTSTGQISVSVTGAEPGTIYPINYSVTMENAETPSITDFIDVGIGSDGSGQAFIEPIYPTDPGNYIVAITVAHGAVESLIHSIPAPMVEGVFQVTDSSNMETQETLISIEKTGGEPNASLSCIIAVFAEDPRVEQEASSLATVSRTYALDGDGAADVIATPRMPKAAGTYYVSVSSAGGFLDVTTVTTTWQTVPHLKASQTLNPLTINDETAFNLTAMYHRAGTFTGFVTFEQNGQTVAHQGDMILTMQTEFTVSTDYERVPVRFEGTVPDGLVPGEAFLRVETSHGTDPDSIVMIPITVVA